MNLEDIIVKKMIDNGCEELTMVLNGEYVTHKSKIVYAHIRFFDDNPALEFYIKNKQHNTDCEVVHNMLGNLTSRLLSSELYGMKVLDDADKSLALGLEQCKFSICSELNLLIMESVLYNAAHQLTSHDKTNMLFKIGEQLIDSTTTNALIDVFRTNSFRVYLKLIYATGNNRFINKLMKYNKFYGIQKAFVPVFIHFEDVYDPFSDKLLGVEDTLLYKTAINKGRKLNFEDKLSCYLLTHEEICRAFGMTHFMRFTPDFCYSVFVGLLKPTLEHFPNKITKVFMTSKDLAETYDLKVRYKPEEYLEVLTETKKLLETENTANNNEKLRALDTYKEVNTLYFSCASTYSRLVGIGSPVLDNKQDTTLPKLYEYIKEALLL